MSEKYTYNQVNEQQSSAYLNGNEDNPTVLVSRNNTGNITVGRLDMGTRTVHFTEDGRQKYKQVPLEALSDQWQADLAEELAATRSSNEIYQSGEGGETPLKTRQDLGAEALESAGVAEPESNVEKYRRILAASDEELEAQSNAYIESQREEQELRDRQSRARAAMDHKYNQVMQATGDSEAAQAAADRVWHNFGL